MKKLICRIVKYLIDILNEVFTWCHTDIVAPTELILTVSCPDTMILNWTSNSNNEDGFYIERSLDGTTWTVIDNVGAGVTTYSDTTLTIDVLYYYRVQAYGSTETSNYSNIASDKCAISYAEVKYGLLYNAYAARDARNIAPIGWHLPTSAEWDTLATTLGGAAVAGGKLKETGEIYWTGNVGATNESGWNGRGSGWRTIPGPVFQNLNTYCYYWATTMGFGRELRSGDDDMHNTLLDSKVGTSVRLIKDDAINTGSMTDSSGNIYPTVTIGAQVWMAHDLMTKKYRNDDDIPEVQDGATWAGLATGAWCYYNNDPNNM